MKKFLSVAICLMGSVCCAETLLVKSVKAMQPYPWENKVYISYEVIGNVAANAENGNLPFLWVLGRDNTSGMTYEAESTNLSGDTGFASGLHKIVWDIGAQGISFNSENISFTIMYCDKLDYLVVDLSAGANASCYPFSYHGSVPSGGWSDEYKTTKLVLRRIEAGSFIMGYDQANESHRVTLTKPFYMGVFEVTQKQWELVMGTNPCSATSKGKGDAYPAHSVSYSMIRGSMEGARWPSSSAVDQYSFMGKLRARTGLNFDLPTEAQWEYACRAGTTTYYYWGDSLDDSYAWYDGESTHVVGTKTPNAWELYDMSGNVFELCLDWWVSSNQRAYGTDPVGPSRGADRVRRGGSWGGSTTFLLSGDSWYDDASSENYHNGFRLVRTL